MTVRDGYPEVEISDGRSFGGGMRFLEAEGVEKKDDTAIQTPRIAVCSDPDGPDHRIQAAV